MNPELFVKLAEGYFGEYRPVVKAEVLRELHTWDARSLEKLWEEAKRTVGTQYKTPPDVCFIEKSEAFDFRKEIAREERIENRTKQLTVGEERFDSAAIFASIRKQIAKGTA